MMQNILEVLIDASLQNWNCDIDGSDGLDLLHAAFPADEQPPFSPANWPHLQGVKQQGLLEHHHDILPGITPERKPLTSPWGSCWLEIPMLWPSSQLAAKENS